MRLYALASPQPSAADAESAAFSSIESIVCTLFAANWQQGVSLKDDSGAKQEANSDPNYATGSVSKG
jgi:hypothetical protein